MAQQRIGRYQVLEDIASGGQGSVHRALDPETGQIVALKVLHSHLISDSAFLERFHREAQLSASIDHPNVIRIFEVGQDGDSHFIAMECWLSAQMGQKVNGDYELIARAP